MAIFPGSAIPSADTTFTIDQSLRFDSATNAYLQRTPAGAGSLTTWTFSAWVKRGIIDLVGGGTNNQFIFAQYTDEAERAGLRFNTGDTIEATIGGASGAPYFFTLAKYRDPSAWYHLVWVYDSTNGAAADRHRLYVNGERAALGTEHQADSSEAGNINTAEPHEIGNMDDGTGSEFDGLMAEVHFIDGTAVAVSEFGEAGDYGEWKPKQVSGLTYGTNGFYLDFAASGDLGDDESGEGNDWTVNNFTAADQMVDSPTNNFATNLPFITKFHPSYPAITHSEGNLKVEFGSAGGGMNGAVSSMAIPSTGKWYMERCILTTGDGYGYPGDGISDLLGDAFPHATKTSYAHGGTINSDGDIYGVGYDADAGTVYWYKNGSQVSTASIAAGLSGETLFFNVSDDQGSGSKKMPFITNYGQDSSFAGKKTAQGNQDANGIGDFYYTVPTDFLALCTSNLPAVAVIPSEHFNTVLYTGTGSSNARTGIGFQPDFVWIKDREHTEAHRLFDSVRGVQKNLTSIGTHTEWTDANSLTAFGSDGFTVGSENAVNGASGHDFVAWNWKAGGSGSANTVGDLDSTVSVNADAGFSIVSYTGDGVNGRTVGHGLGSAPEMIILKTRETYFTWGVGHDDLTWAKYINLDSTAAADTGGGTFNSVAPTSTLFTVADNYNVDTEGHIGYCFKSVDGYSKVGSYEGNDNADGTFVYTGFSPKFILFKNIERAGQDWGIYDNVRHTTNPLGDRLFANDTPAESANTDNIDFLSNGFKWRDNSYVNNYTETYIYIAFAETPFKYSNAR